jgi:hydrogenase small subunit
VTNTHQFGVEANADKVGLATAGIVGAAAASHAAVTAIKNAQKKGDQDQ